MSTIGKTQNAPLAALTQCLQSGAAKLDVATAQNVIDTVMADGRIDRAELDVLSRALQAPSGTEIGREMLRAFVASSQKARTAPSAARQSASS